MDALAVVETVFDQSPDVLHRQGRSLGVGRDHEALSAGHGEPDLRADRIIRDAGLEAEDEGGYQCRHVGLNSSEWMHYGLTGGSAILVL